MLAAVSSRGIRRRKSSTTARRPREVAWVLEASRNTCRWRRTIAPEVLAALARAVADVRAPSVAEAGDGTVAALLVRDVLPEASAEVAAWLARDIERVRRAFRALRPNEPTSMQLEIVTSDKCRRFHADYKVLRAVCTYVGPSTEWLDDDAIDREALADRSFDIPLEAQNARIVRDPSAIRRAPPGDVVILKGEAAEGNRGRGAVHRSPPVEATGARRLVLTLDFP